MHRYKIFFRILGIDALETGPNALPKVLDFRLEQAGIFLSQRKEQEARQQVENVIKENPTPLACALYGYIWELGIGGQQSDIDAAEWFAAAQKGGSAEGTNGLRRIKNRWSKFMKRDQSQPLFRPL